MAGRAHRRRSPPTRRSPSRAPRSQAEMVRAGEVSPTELVQLSLGRIERHDPELNAFRKVFAEKALLEAEQAEARLKAGEERPLLGVPIAIKDEVDVAGEVTTHRHRRLRRAGEGGLRDGAAAARGGRDRRRPDPAARDGDLRLHRVGDLRGDPQPLEPAAHARRLERRLGRRRSPPAWSRSPRPATAPARSGSRRPPAASSASSPRAAGSRWRPNSKDWDGLAVDNCVSRTVLDTALWLDVVAGGSQEAEAPPPPERPFVESAKTPPGKLRVAWSTAAPRALAPPTVSERSRAAVAEAAELLGSLGHDVAQQRPRLGRDRQQHHARFLRGVARDRRGSPPPGAPRTAHPRLRPARASILPDGLFEQAPRRRPRGGRRPRQRDLRLTSTSWSRR